MHNSANQAQINSGTSHESEAAIQAGVIGHGAVVSFFNTCIRQQTLAHAYLIQGPYAVGKWTLATRVARAIVQTNKLQHPDMLILDPEGPITIDMIRDIKHAVSMSPHSAAFKVCLINNAHRMTEEAQNALLKTLEEPPAHSIIMLVTNQPERLLQTIMSRVVALSCGFVPRPTLESTLPSHGISLAQLATVYGWFGGRPGMYLSWAQDPSIEQVFKDAAELFAKLPTLKAHEKIDIAAMLAEHEQSSLILEHWIVNLRTLLLARQGINASSISASSDTEDAHSLDARTLAFARKDLAGMITKITRMRATLELSINRKLAFEHLLFNL